MGIVIVLLIEIAIVALAIALPVIAKILINLDYVFLFLLLWYFLFRSSGFDGEGLLLKYQIHTVFVILIYLVALAAWFGLQQIRVFNIYVFRFVACGLSAYVFTYCVKTGLLGQTIANGMNTIWTWTVGIVYFAIVVFLRVKDKSLAISD